MNGLITPDPKFPTLTSRQSEAAAVSVTNSANSALAILNNGGSTQPQIAAATVQAQAALAGAYLLQQAQQNGSPVRTFRSAWSALLTAGAALETKLNSQLDLPQAAYQSAIFTLTGFAATAA